MPGSLTIRRARLVLPDRVVTGDLVVADGVIEAIGAQLGRSAGEEIDGQGLTVLPGLVDGPVAMPLVDDDDAAVLAHDTGTAARAGVTSVMLRDTRRRLVEDDDLDAVLARCARHARVHHGVLRDGNANADDTRHAATYVCLGERGGQGVADDVDDRLAHAAGLVVAEGQSPARMAERETLYADAVDPGEHGRIYPPEVAADAVREVVLAARRVGARLHLSRTTSIAELDVLGEVDGVDASAAISLAHLVMEAGRASARLGPRAVTDPPLRDAEEVAAMWAALRDDRVGMVASGHGFVTPGVKATPYPGTPGELPTLGAWLPLLLDRVHRGEISLVQVARWTADAPAQRWGLKRVGRLEVGFDGDLVLVDADADVTVEASHGGASGWSPFEGFTLKGRPVLTALRGQVVSRDGRLVDGVRGRALGFSRA